MSEVSRQIATGVTCALLLAVGLGCAGSRGAPTSSADAPSASPAVSLAAREALIQVEGDAFVAAVDTRPMRPLSAPGPLRIPPGRRALGVRRRKGAWAHTQTTSDAAGGQRRVSSESCTLEVDLRADAEYRLAISDGADAWSWKASLTGPGLDATCVPRVSARELVGRDLFLCCAMRFDGGVATDANYLYRYSSDPMLAAGTRVRVTDAGRMTVDFSTADGRRYRLWFKYGRGQLDGPTYFGRIFVSEDPTVALAGASPAVLEAVRAGRVIAGMTRAQVLLARGYPPAHQTPDLEAAQWLFYDEAGTGEYVSFHDGVVTAVRRGPAP